MQVETISVRQAIDNRGDYYESSYIYFKKFPILLDTNLDRPHKSRIVLLVDQILKNKEENPEADISELEEEINQLVYEFYGLSGEGIEIVESILG